MIKYIAMLILIPTLAIAGAKTIGDKKDYTRQQKIQRGDIIEPKMTTCRLKKILKSKKLLKKLLKINF